MKYTYTNTREAGVRVYTKDGPLFIQPNATITVDEPLQGVPYWIVPVNLDDPLVQVQEEEPLMPITTVTVTEETPAAKTTVAKTTKARRRKTTTEKE